MSEKVKFFLEAADPDTLQSARGELGDLEEKDILLIRSTLRKWELSLAVSNLLFYPEIIPPEIRIESIFKGLSDQHNPYIALAATVGLQNLDPQDISEEDRKYLVKKLLEIIDRQETILADRASVSILPFLHKDEMESVFTLLSNPSETVRHNLLGWLYKTLAQGSHAGLKEKLAREKIPLETRKKLEKILDRDEQRVNAGLPSLLALPRYAYIPSRNDRIS